MKQSWIITALTFGLLLANTFLGNAAQIDLKPYDNRVEVLIDQKPFTTYLWQLDPNTPLVAPGRKFTKPVLFPLYSPSGEKMVRSYPFQQAPGESADHPHHMGVYFTVDINDDHFWGNSSADLPAIRHQKINRLEPGKDKAILATQSLWINHNNHPIIEENRTMTFGVLSPSQWTIDLDITLTALDSPVTIADTKEGMLAIRVAPWLKESAGQGQYLNSENARTESKIWGRRARWVQLQAPKDQETLGLVIFNHPASTNYPTFWHARAYGCFAANPIGQSIFQQTLNQPNPQKLNLTLQPNQPVPFRHRILVYESSLTPQQVEALFKTYARIP